MLSRIFPATAGNDFRGLRPAIWLLVPIVAVRAGQGLECIVNAQETAMRADSIPVASFEPAAQATIVLLFALSGVAFVLLALIGALILIRYRALTTLAYLLLLTDYAIRRTVVATHPTLRAGGEHVAGFSVGSLLSYTLLAIMIVGLVLSLIRRAEPGRTP